MRVFGPLLRAAPQAIGGWLCATCEIDGEGEGTEEDEDRDES